MINVFRKKFYLHTGNNTQQPTIIMVKRKFEYPAEFMVADGSRLKKTKRAEAQAFRAAAMGGKGASPPKPPKKARKPRACKYFTVTKSSDCKPAGFRVNPAKASRDRCCGKPRVHGPPRVKAVRDPAKLAAKKLMTSIRRKAKEVAREKKAKAKLARNLKRELKKAVRERKANQLERKRASLKLRKAVKEQKRAARAMGKKGAQAQKKYAAK